MLNCVYTIYCDCIADQCSFDWSTIIAAIIAAFIAILGYIWQKSTDRQAQNRENSKQAYLEFLDDFNEPLIVEVKHEKYFNSLSDADKKKYKLESDKKRLHARSQILLFGSDNVINAYLNFIKHIDDVIQNKVPDIQEDYITKLLLEIRKEIYPNTNMVEDDISKYFNGINRP